MNVTDACRRGGVSQHTFYRWRTKFGGMDPRMTMHLQELEKEDSRRKRLLEDAELDEAICLGGCLGLQKTCAAQLLNPPSPLGKLGPAPSLLVPNGKSSLVTRKMLNGRLPEVFSPRAGEQPTVAEAPAKARVGNDLQVPCCGAMMHTSSPRRQFLVGCESAGVPRSVTGWERRWHRHPRGPFLQKHR